MNALILIIFVFCLFSAKVNDYLFLMGWILTLINLCLLYKTKRSRVNSIDILVLCYCVYDLVSIIISYNSHTTYSNFINTYALVTFYFICRKLVNTVDRVKKVVLPITLFSSTLPLFIIPSFCKTFSKLEALHFGTFVSDFKFIFTPLGMSINTWTTFLIYILLLQSLCMFLYRKNKKYIICILPGFISSLFLLVNSFTRGIYICLIIYVVSFFIVILKSELKKKQRIITLLAVFFILGSSCCYYGRDVIKTTKLLETTSQQRSLEGRVQSIDISYDIFKHSPLTGVGSGNFGYAENFIEASGDVTSFPGNTLFQLLAEKGIVGCVIVLSLIVLLFINLFRYKGEYDTEKKIFIAFLVIIMCREVSYPSILMNSSTQSVFFFFLAIIQFYFMPCRYFVNKTIRRIVCLSSILICITVSFHTSKMYYDNECCKEAVLAIEKGNLKEAEILLKRASSNIVPNFNRGIVHWNLYKKDSQKYHLSKAKEMMQSCIEAAPVDYVFQYNLAQIYAEEGDTVRANSILKSLNSRYPEKILFNLVRSQNNEHYESMIFKILMKNPRIIRSKYYNSFIAKESHTEDTIKNYIKEQSEKMESENDPISYAKYGKLLLWSGDTLKAKKFLLDAIELLPNLIEPRYNLSVIEHFQRNKAMEDMYMSQYVALTKKHLEKGNYGTCIDETYYNHFFEWYGGNVSPNEIIF